MIVPVQQVHIDEIVVLNDICGFPQRSAGGWRWALFDNPQQGDLSSGFVFLQDEKVVGFTGRQRRLLFRQGETITYACGHTTLTNLKNPGVGFRLLRHSIGANPCEIGATLNNNALSAPIYPRLKFPAWLGENGRYFAERVLNYSKTTVSAALRWLADEDVGADVEHFPYQAELAFAKMELGGFRRIDPEAEQCAADLDEFHDAMRDGPLFQADRSSKTWRHRCADPDAQDVMHLFASYAGGRIEALLAMSITKETERHPATGEIEDMAIRPGVSVQPEDLLVAAETFGRAAKLAKMKLRYMRGVTEPGYFPNSNWRLRKKNFDCIHGRASDERFLKDWSLGPIDGDFYFALRRIPQKQTGIVRLSA